METRTDYFKAYYDKNKDVLNERRLFDYYVQKFGKDFVENIKQNHENAIDVLKKHSRLQIKLIKVQRQKDRLQTELNNLESMKSKL
jgi:hypothetical protein